ncbi:uncharacterized protein LOC142538338 [Primulina tabacum]|uniref:uncharacterized protein LOC142538338 n=1 Tax=Primulina tabacum TaxID=48773 RepID=UPI003F59ECCB
MALEVFPDSPNLVISPRISFSHDLSANNVVPIERYLRSNHSSIDFDFCVFNESFGQNSSPADELFSDGKILPIQIKKPLPPPHPPVKTAAAPPPQPPDGKHTTPYLETRKPIPESEEKHRSKSSFWGFKCRTSLNGGSGHNGRGLCSLPFLSRSKSTGSNTNVKRPSNMKQSLVRSSSCSQQKLPLKKSNHASYCYGVKIHPVLNVPPANLFGLGSIFNKSGTNKRNKK